MKRPNEIHSERANGRLRVQIDCSEGGRTEQTHRDTCNINTIMQKAVSQGVMPLNERIAKASYGDFTEVGSFQHMQNTVKQAESEFMALPSHIRSFFKNDPGKLIDFLQRPENKKQAILLGLIKPTPTPAPEPVPEPVTQPVTQPES